MRLKRDPAKANPPALRRGFPGAKNPAGSRAGFFEGRRRLTSYHFSIQPGLIRQGRLGETPLPDKAECFEKWRQLPMPKDCIAVSVR